MWSSEVRSPSASFLMAMDCSTHFEEELSIEDLIEKIIQDPARLDELLETLFKQSDAFNAICQCLDLLFKKQQPSSIVVSKCAYELVSMLPMKFKVDLIEKSPPLFLQFLQILPIPGRQLFLKCLIHRLKNWREVLTNGWKTFNQRDEDPSLLIQKKQGTGFLSSMNDYLSPRRFKQWVKFCGSELPPKEWAAFICSLENKERLLAFNESTRRLPLNFSKQGYLLYLQELAQKFDSDTEVVKSLFNKVLRRFYCERKTPLFLKQFLQLSSKAQLVFLSVMQRKNRSKVFAQYSSEIPLMAFWAAGLFRYEKNFRKRVEILSMIRFRVPDEKFVEWMTALNRQNFPGGAYFLVFLYNQKFADFTLSTPCAVRSELFTKNSFDHNALELLDSIHHHPSKQFLCETMGLEMENSTIPIDPSAPFTLKGIFQILKQIASLPIEQVDDYHSFIARIPPLFIGLAAFDQDDRAILILLVRYLSLEQLKFFITPLNISEACEMIERLMSILKPEQLMALLEALPFKTLVHYTHEKTQQLQERNKEFIEKEKVLNRELTKAQEKESLSSTSYEELQAKMREIRGLAKSPSLMGYYQLFLFLKCLLASPSLSAVDHQTLSTAFDSFKSAREKLNHKQALVEGPAAIIKQKIDALEKLIKMDEEEEQDLTEVIYPGFWRLLKEGTLPYLGMSPHSSLGITHGGQLPLVGIHTNEDLNYLGISQESQNKVENWPDAGILTELVKNFKNNEEKRRMIFTLWENFLEIRLSAKEIAIIGKRFIGLLEWGQQDAIYMKTFCLKFYEHLKTFKHICSNDQQALTKGVQSLKVCQEPRMLAVLSVLVLERELLVLRSQHPLFCLQRYLVGNPHLKATWEKLKLLGYRSISDLAKKNQLRNVGDLLQLDRIATTLSYTISHK